MKEKTKDSFKKSWIGATSVAEDIAKFVHAPRGSINKFPSQHLIESVAKLHEIRTFAEKEHLRMALQGFSDAQIIEYLNLKRKRTL